ncbi:cobalt-precorrin-6A reductase [Actinoplanes sp. NPDC051633]|uniref:cobalt-precorrin-6A reductase n=1 Tax=Actinoplanes sp. NPDC051633 TaxID=3155670 RepID=UPI00344A0A3D
MSAEPTRGDLRVLILGGTTEGRLLATACRGLAGVRTISSLAGRTDNPIIPAGELRIGGFGGVAGLVAFLEAEKIGAIVDATHVFARTMTEHAYAAAQQAGVPLLLLRRPGWTERAGDRWQRVPSVTAAAEALTGGRVFLTTGRQEIGAFAGRGDCWFLARSVEPPQPPMPARMEVLLDRGPFTVEGELALLREHRIDVLVTKDSGGADAKLVAARTEGVPVIMVDRPPAPAAPSVPTVDAAVTWLTVRAAE